MKKLKFLLVCGSLVAAMGCTECPPCPPAQEPATPVDPTAANRALIEQYFAHFNSHDWAKMSAMYSDTAEMKDPSLGVGIFKQSPADISKKYAELQQGIPDVHDSVVTMLAAADQVVVEFVSSGTGPDGVRFELPICTIFKIANGKITQDFTYYDNFSEEPQP